MQSQRSTSYFHPPGRRLARAGVTAAGLGIAVALAAFSPEPVSGLEQDVLQSTVRRGIVQTVRPNVFTGDVRSLPPAAAAQGDIVDAPRYELPWPDAPQRPAGAEYPMGLAPLQTLMGGGFEVTPESFLMPNPNFDGIPATGFTPPDTIGDIGPDHYVQAVNAAFQIFDRQGNALTAAANINTLWTGFGGFCENNNRGDPVVNYDHLADRWLISQFTGIQGQAEFHQCIAISQTADPVTGGWYLYDFLMPASNDYPKIGVWPDAYYMGTQRGFPGGGLDVFAFDRANMLNGNPATMQTFNIGAPSLFLLPGDLDGDPPAPGTPAPFIRHVDGEQWGGADRVEIFEFSVDWSNPAASTFSGPTALATLPFDAICGGAAMGLTQACVDQPGTGQQVESLAAWMLWRLQYRNFGTHETLVTNHSIDVDGTEHAGVRWYEIRRVAGLWTMFQQGTFAPDAGAPGLADDPHRFMASAAMDREGNIAVGYSASSTTLFPEIRYAGRLAADPNGLLPHGEVTMQVGTGSQTGTNRWGDYSSMNLDPVDGCTFWYTQEYMPASGNWRTRIGAFRFASCNEADLRIAKTARPSPATAGAPLFYDIIVTNDGPSQATNVVVVDTLPAGVDYVTDTDSCVEAPAGTLTCSLGSIASGASVSFTIRVDVDPGLVVAAGGATTITNVATVSSDQQDPDPSDNTVSVTTVVEERADLLLTKQCKPDGPIAAGGTATCTIFVDNLGPSDARDVVVIDTHLSDGAFTIVSATFTPPGAACGIAGGVVTCNLGTEPAGGRTTITVEITSDDGVDVNDTATVSSPTPDPNLGNNIDTGTVSFTGLSDLSVTKTALPDPVVAGETLTYMLSVSNAGPSIAPNVMVDDVLPSWVSVVSFTPSQGSCIAGDPGEPLEPFRCEFGDLAASASATVTLVVLVNPSTPDGTILTNNAVVSSENADPDEGDNVVTESTTVAAEADLVITKTSDKPKYKASSIVTYTVGITNNGPSDAQAVVITDNLPPLDNQTIYLSDTGGCTLSGSILTCNVGTLAAGASWSFDIQLNVKGNQGEVSNTASVASSTTDPVLLNNTVVYVVTVGK